MQPPGSGTQTWYASNQTLMTHAPRAYPQMKNASRGSTVRLRKGQRSPRRDKDTNVLNRSGLNPRRACIKRALTPSACVCKPAAAKFTSNYERSPAWHSATDWKLNSTFVTDIHGACPETRSGRLRCALRSAVRLLSRAWSPQRMHAPQQKRCGDQIRCEDRASYLCRLHPCGVLAAFSTPFMKCQ